MAQETGTIEILTTLSGHCLQPGLEAQLAGTSVPALIVQTATVTGVVPQLRGWTYSDGMHFDGKLKFGYCSPTGASSDDQCASGS